MGQRISREGCGPARQEDAGEKRTRREGGDRAGRSLRIGERGKAQTISHLVKQLSGERSDAGRARGPSHSTEPWCCMQQAHPGDQAAASSAGSRGDGEGWRWGRGGWGEGGREQSARIATVERTHQSCSHTTAKASLLSLNVLFTVSPF